MSPSKNKAFESIPLAITSCLGILLAVGADVWAYNALLAGRVIAPLLIAGYFTTLAATGWHFHRTGRMLAGWINSLLWLGLTVFLTGCAAWLAWIVLFGKSQLPGLGVLLAIISLILSVVFAFCCIVTHACVQYRKEELIKPPPPYEKLPPAKIPEQRK
jgi:hypothetical protein